MSSTTGTGPFASAGSRTRRGTASFSGTPDTKALGNVATYSAMASSRPTSRQGSKAMGGGVSRAGTWARATANAARTDMGG